MAVLTISRGSYSHGKEIAEKAGRKLGYTCISRETLLAASEAFNIPEIALLRAFEDTPSFLDRFTHGKEKYTAYIQAALLNQLKKDNVVYHGFACHAIVKDIPRILNVRINAQLEDRVQIVMERDQVSEKQAVRFLKKLDDDRRKWSRKLYGVDPENPGLYDLVLNLNKITITDAVNTICNLISLRQFQTIPESKKQMENLALAAQVKTALLDLKPRLEVSAGNGIVVVKTDTETAKNLELVRRMREAGEIIPGVKRINVMAGEAFETDYPRPPESRQKSTRDTTLTYFGEL
ncbi:MAG: cytidylate kinase-like family protein [Desulfatiglandaceae bacterium]